MTLAHFFSLQHDQSNEASSSMFYHGEAKMKLVSAGDDGTEFNEAPL